MYTGVVFFQFGKKGVSSLFAPADKFSEMLEEAGASKMKLGTAHDISNKDNAGMNSSKEGS